MHLSIHKAISSIALCCLAIASQAAPIKWTLNDFVLHDGGFISGSFVFDEDTLTFSQISISNTAGTVGTAGALNELCSEPKCPPSGFGILAFADAPPAEDMRGIKLLIMLTPEGLTNAGGTIPVTSGSTGTCNSADCSNVPPDAQNVTFGSLIGVPYLAPQSITFISVAPSSAQVGNTYEVAATGGTSGAPVTFSIHPAVSAVCSITGNTVSLLAEGTCTINANQTGNATYEPAAQAVQNFNVYPVAAQPPTVATPIPTLNQWGLALLAALLGCFVFLRQHRKS
jgi:hypothetical protein